MGPNWLDRMMISGQLALGVIGAKFNQVSARRAAAAAAAAPAREAAAAARKEASSAWWSNMRSEWGRSARNALPSAQTNVGGGRRGLHSPMRTRREAELGRAAAGGGLVDADKWQGNMGFGQNHQMNSPFTPSANPTAGINIPVASAWPQSPPYRDPATGRFAKRPANSGAGAPAQAVDEAVAQARAAKIMARGKKSASGFTSASDASGVGQILGMAGMGSAIGAGSAYLTGGDTTQGAMVGGLLGAAGGAYSSQIRSGLASGIVEGSNLLAPRMGGVPRGYHGPQSTSASQMMSTADSAASAITNRGRAYMTAAGGGLAGGLMFSGHRRKNTGNFNAQRGNYIGG